MSSEYSSGSRDHEDDPEPTKALFSAETYLTNAAPILHQWKANLDKSDLDYLRQEVTHIGAEAELLRSGQQVRLVGFVSVLSRAIQDTVNEYERAYQNTEHKTGAEVAERIGELDGRLQELVKYLHVVETNNGIVFYSNAYPEANKQIYQLLERAAAYCVNLETLWLLLLTPKMFQESDSTYLYKACFAAEGHVYDKEARLLLNKHNKVQGLLTASRDSQPISLIELVAQMQRVATSSLKEPIKFKVAAVIKGRFYTQHSPKSLKEEFVRHSLAMYYGEAAGENWDCSKYEELCLQITKEVLIDPKQYMDCFLFMEPQAVDFQQRKLIVSFANFFKACLEDILKMQEPGFEAKLSLPIEFLQSVLDQHHCQLFMHLVINFQTANKKVFFLQDPPLHALFLSILDHLKQIYLSMGRPVCLLPTNMFTSVTNRFFIRNSEDLSPQIKLLLPQMVSNFVQQKMPHRFCPGMNEPIPLRRIEFLSVIMYYIEDCNQKNEDTYLDLPDFYPTGLESAILFLEVLKMKLKHHDPPEDLRQYYTNILEECVNLYKIKPDFSWFRNSRKNYEPDREVEFKLHKEIEPEWAHQMLQDVLNVRDENNAEDLHNSYKQSRLTLAELISYSQFAVGAKTSFGGINIQEEELFYLLEEIPLALICCDSQLAGMDPDKKRMLNHAHVCLGLYNTKIQEAKGSDIYLAIVQNILLPWVRLPLKAATKFRDEYHFFFSDFIVKDLYMVLGEGMLGYFSEAGVEALDKDNVIAKLKYFCECLDKGSIRSMPLESNQEFLSTVVSILHEGVDVEIILQFVNILGSFLDAQEELQPIFSMDLLMDSIFNSQERILLALSAVQREDTKKMKRLLAHSIANKLPQYYYQCTVASVIKLLKFYFHHRSCLDNNEFYNLLQQLLKNLDALQADRQDGTPHCQLLHVLKALVSLSIIVDDFHPEQFKEPCRLHWSQLQAALEKEEVALKDIPGGFTLCSLLSAFTPSLFNAIKNIVKGLQAKEPGYEPTGDEQPGATWRKLVQRCGSLEDFILFNEDISLLLQRSAHSPFASIKNFIVEKSITHAMFKKILNRIPAAKESAEEVIKQLKASVDPEVSSQMVCKLILINSKFQSDLIEEFILENLHRVDPATPIKIYQPYLVAAIKNELKNVEEDFLRSIFIKGEYHQENNYLFSKVLCLPLKKFEKVQVLKKREPSAEENEEWETESEGDKNSDSQRKKKNKKDRVASESSALEEHEEDLMKVMMENDGEENEMENSQESMDFDAEYDVERPPLMMFFKESHLADLELYKQIMVARERLNILVQDDYRIFHLESVYAVNKPEIDAIAKEIADLLQRFTESDFSKLIYQKFPASLRTLLAANGLEISVDDAEIENERRPEAHLPEFDQQDSDAEESEEMDEEEMEMDEEEGDESISDESDDDSDDIQIENDDEDEDNEESISEEKEEKTIHEELCTEELMGLELPDLQEINSKIESELSGNELTPQEIRKIIELAILHLFNLSPGEFKLNQSARSFYRQILESRDLFRIFANTFLTIMRVHESSCEAAAQLERKLEQQGLSFKKALFAFIQILLTFSSEDEAENKDYVLRIFASSECPGDLLPIADELILSFDLPIQDNLLTLLILYSKYKMRDLHEELGHLLSKSLSIIAQNEESDSNCRNLTPSRAKALTAHIYNNNSSSSIWADLEDILGISVPPHLILKSCLPAYRTRLLNHLQSALHPITGHNKVEEDMLPYAYQEKVAEYALKLYHKKIKHYYFWTRRAFHGINESDQKEQLRRAAVKIAETDEDLMRLTELMMFHLHDLQQRFHHRSEEKVFKKMTALPRSIIETSFKYLRMVDGWVQRWKPASQIKLFFQNYRFGELPFTHLEQPCNLVLQFLNIPAFCTPKLKQAIIPCLIKSLQKKSVMSEDPIDRPAIIYDLPLAFKLPPIPDSAEGQPVFATRSCSFDMVFYQMKSKSMLVEFHEEDGSDHGGMVRELMMGWKGEGVGEEYFLIGKLLGMSFTRGIPYGGKLDFAMAVALTNFHPDLDFFRTVDKSIYESLKYIAECTDEAEIEDLEQRFIISHEKYGQIKEFPLKENGQNIDLNLGNKQEYLQLYSQHYFRAGREWELEQLKAGFYSVVNKHYASIFHPLELIQKIRGEEVEDYTKLKKKAKYEEGYSEDSEIIKWLWQIISRFTQSEMNMFIQFLTGAPKVSIYDPNFNFVVEKTYGEDIERLPVAHTCFNTLDLPEYKTKEILEKKLRQAIFEGNGNFGII